LDKKKYKDKYGLTDLQYDLIMENLRNNQWVLKWKGEQNV
jgi:hypothetical protein